MIQKYGNRKYFCVCNKCSKTTDTFEDWNLLKKYIFKKWTYLWNKDTSDWEHLCEDCKKHYE